MTIITKNKLRKIVTSYSKQNVGEQLNTLLVITFFLSAFLKSEAQNLHFSFPAFPERDVKSYFYRGDKMDSLVVKLDEQGRGSGYFPIDYRGFVQAMINNTSLVEFIAGEDELIVLSLDTRPSSKNTQFLNSQENDFFNTMFERKKQNLQEKAWIETGIKLNEQDRKMQKLLHKKTEQNAKEQTAIKTETKNSPLYAARFLEILDFAEILVRAESEQDIIAINYVKKYLQNKMNWKALYTSGRLWTGVHNFTISMFNKENPNRSVVENQQVYAAFMAPLLKNVEEPVRSGMLRSIITECEAFGWTIAKNDIATYILENNIKVNTYDFKISRLMQAYKARAGEPALSITGIEDLTNCLLVFYESDCSNCETILKQLEESYANLAAYGIRIVSIAADVDEKIHKKTIEHFPWSDKLCDYKAFLGESFEKYGIMGTPTLIRIDRNGIIKGRYSRLQDVEW